MGANLGSTTPFARVVYHYPAFIEAIRDRTVDLQISRLEIDRISGLPQGFSGKALSRNPVKRIGLRSLGPLLETLGLILMIVEDPAARDRTLARRAPFVDCAEHGIVQPHNHLLARAGRSWWLWTSAASSSSSVSRCFTGNGSSNEDCTLTQRSLVLVHLRPSPYIPSSLGHRR